MTGIYKKCDTDLKRVKALPVIVWAIENWYKNIGFSLDTNVKYIWVGSKRTY